jgi:hypothetical protein
VAVDTSKLTREDKIELLLAMEEKRKRELLAKPKFKPNEGQLQIVKDGAKFKERFVFSGNGFGKTALLVNEAKWVCDGYNPVTKQFSKVPARVYMVLDSPEKVDQKVIPELRKWFVVTDKQLHKQGKPYTSKITFDNGSCIQFLFFDMDEFKFEGIDNFDALLSDEPLPKRIYLGMFRGLREKGSQPKVLVCGTPLGQPWLRTDIWEPWSKGLLPDTNCYRYSSELNKANLRDGWLEEFASKMTEAERQVRLEGSFFDLEGLALAKYYRAETHLVDPHETWNKDWPCVIAIDPHPSKNHVACLVGADRDGYLYYIKEISSASPAKQFAKELKDMYQGYRVIDIICDSLGATPGSGGDGNLSFMDVLRKNGVQARSTSYKEKDDEDFIQKIQQVLLIPEVENNFGQKIPKLRVYRYCRGIIGDISNVEWQRDKNLGQNKPKLAISNTDYLACLKYALATGISFRKDKAKVIRSKNKSPWGGS